MERLDNCRNSNKHRESSQRRAPHEPPPSPLSLRATTSQWSGEPALLPESHPIPAAFVRWHAEISLSAESDSSAIRPHAKGAPPPSSGCISDKCAMPPYPLRRLRHRSEEHTSELQSRQYLVCRLLLEKKKTNYTSY